MCKHVKNMPEYVWVYDNRQGSEHVSYNTQRKVTLQVNEYKLIERWAYPEPAKDGVLLENNHFCKKLSVKYLRGFWICDGFLICQSSEY